MAILPAWNKPKAQDTHLQSLWPEKTGCRKRQYEQSPIHEADSPLSSSPSPSRVFPPPNILSTSHSWPTLRASFASIARFIQGPGETQEFVLFPNTKRPWCQSMRMFMAYAKNRYRRAGRCPSSNTTTLSPLGSSEGTMAIRASSSNFSYSR